VSEPPVVAAVVQLSCQDDVGANLTRVRHWIALAAQAGARIVALPENFAFMGEEAEKCRVAEPLTPPYGPIVSTLVECARSSGAYLVGGGMPEVSGDPHRPFNTSVMVGPEGEILARYRKLHLFDVDLPDGTKLAESRSTSWGAPGDLAVERAAGIPLGMTICYDLRFPELYRALETRGARVVTVPAAFTLVTGKDHWHVLLRARAIENQVYVLAPAQTGKHPKGRQTYGKSLIVDPWGDVVAQVGDGEGFAITRIDLEYQAKVRQGLPSLLHKRL
jgi:deaminated glutathione amidase